MTPIEYNNPAGRLLFVFERFSTKTDAQFKDFSSLLGINDDCDSILLAIADVRAEFRLLSEEIEQFADNPAKLNLYKKNLPEVEASINSFSLDLQRRVYSCDIAPTAIVALRFIAADLEQEEEADTNDLESLQSTIAELQTQILDSEDLVPSLRTWLLELVRLMRDGIDRFQIRRGRGMRKQFHTMLGDLMDHYDAVQTVKSQHPSIWQHLSTAMDGMIKLAVFREKYKPAIDMVRRALPFFGDADPRS